MKKYALFAQNLGILSPGYHGSLLFFNDISEMREQMLALDESYNVDATAAEREEILGNINDFCRGLNINHVDEEYVEKVQHLLGSHCQVVYIGKTQDLAKVENEFAGALRAEFRGETDDPSPEYMEPVSRTDQPEFMEFLENWRVEED